MREWHYNGAIDPDAQAYWQAQAVSLRAFLQQAKSKLGEYPYELETWLDRLEQRIRGLENAIRQQDEYIERLSNACAVATLAERLFVESVAHPTTKAGYTEVAIEAFEAAKVFKNVRDGMLPKKEP